jgi:oxygen-independent coproporphyrinogen-3 oxidase
MIDVGVLEKFDRPVPRYTSYPTAPQFYPVEESLLIEKLGAFDKTERALSIYLHIPFCKTMCLFCGCSVVLNRDPVRQERYLNMLLKEIALTTRFFSKRRKVSQLHLGGGTPTSLTEAEFERLMGHLRASFEFVEGAEVSIEIDPRTVYADGGLKLAFLKKLGFNRVSFGVQDLDPAVQEAVKRRQSEEMTTKTYFMARELGFDGINIDLIYGLPLQTAASFAKTAEKLLALRPDRIAFYSYAKVPWLKMHQKAIPDDTLPSAHEKFQIYVETREAFMKGGYLPIGMDHFSLESDAIAKAYRNKTLTRNFQGYAVALADDMLAFGITAIGFLVGCFFQNVKTLPEYEAKIVEGKLAVAKGFVLQRDDLCRRFVIQSLMCHFAFEKKEFQVQFGLDFDDYFANEKGRVAELVADGLIEKSEDAILPTPLGRLFIRLVASAFDAYIDKGQFSRAV